MKKIIFCVVVLLVATNISFGQNCNCATDFEWVRKTFEDNDAGFQYALEAKGKQAYEAHNQIFLQKIKQVQPSETCTQLLYEWLTFFRAGHIGIRLLNNNATSTQKQTTPKPNWEVVKTTTSEFEQYLSSKKEIDYEGIWETSPYKMGIKKIGTTYVGFIIETSVENWKQGEVKFKIEAPTSGTFFIRDKSAEKFTTVKALGKNYLALGRFSLKRLFPKYETPKSIETYTNLIAAEKPYVETLNATTVLLRIPSFDDSQKHDIDSVILANKQLILKTENLIIDLRNNGGGSDRSYAEVIPFLYTNPIREVGMEMFSTKLNNQRMLDLINNPQYDFSAAEKTEFKTAYDTLQKHIGNFVNLDSTKVRTQKLDTIYPYPKNVGIIIHKGNGSTTEQFLLAAKQSKKVKLFGATTFGVLDISNMNFVKSPCNEFELGYSLSKSFRIPDMTIDSKGIQPDYFLDSEIADHQWLDYVSNILNQR